MTDQDCKLTIGIPIFNGETSLATVIDSILEQIEQDQITSIEILISDNASTDKTSEIGNIYKQKYPNFISYYRNKENLGYDKNLDTIVTKAKGQYIWFLGCSDKPSPNSIITILKRLDSDNYDNILLNFDIFSEVNSDSTPTNQYPTDKPAIYKSPDDFMKKLNGPALAVSANIVSKKAWLNIISIPLLVDGWAHIERIFAILLNNEYKKTLFIRDICFTLRQEKDGWWTTPLAYINFIRLAKIVKNLKHKKIKKSTWKILFKRIYPFAYIKAILIGKHNKLHLSRPLLLETISIFKNKISFWIICIPLLYLPNFLYRQFLIDFYDLLIYKSRAKIKGFIKMISH